ncbi:hypothetical protein [Sphingopyxis chilensis]
MSAIAAFLVLSTPGAFAQETPAITMTPPVAAPTPTTPQTPPTVSEPGVPAPVTTPETAQPPASRAPATRPAAPTPVIRVPLEIEPAETAPTQKAAERAAPAQSRTERAVPRAKAADAPAAPEPAAAPPISAEATPAEDPALIPTPVTAAAEPAAEVASPPPVESVGTREFPWELAGGAAAFLIVGGAGLAFARRRRNERAVAKEVQAYDHEPVISPAPVMAETMRADAQPWITPAYAPRERVEAPRTTPAFAAAPSGSMGRHEAMALAGPTPGNPFATLSKRLKRARFLDRQERVAYDETLAKQQDMTRKPVSAWEIAQREVTQTPAEQEVRRPERSSVRPGTLRPGFARN